MLDRLSQADRVCGVSAAVAVIATFLPWYRFDSGSSRVTLNGFGAGFLGDVVFFAAAATLILVLVRAGVIATRHRREELATGFVAAGAVGLLAAIVQLLVGVNGSGALRSASFGLGVELLCTIGMAIGAAMQRRLSVPSRGYRYR